LGNDGVWVATAGGVYRSDFGTGTVQTYTAIDGLSGVSAAAVAFDRNSGAAWIGYGDGILDRLNPETGAVSSFRDIARADQFASKRINRIVTRGDTLLIATDFGLVVFDAEKGEVRDSYTRLGTFTPGIPVYGVTVAPLDGGDLGIWLATAEGVAIADIDAPNLQDPNVWSTESVFGRACLDVTAFEGDLFVGTVLDAARRDSAGTYVELGASSESVTDLRSLGERLVGIAESRLFQISSVGQRALSSDQFNRPTGVVSDGASLWIGDAEAGLVQAKVHSKAPSPTCPHPLMARYGRVAYLAVDSTGWTVTVIGQVMSGNSFPC
jgi:ligand-binding sensor domain-containing protein